jgi:hypothetical protein
VNVAVNAVISAGKGITTLMVFSDSFIVPAMPFTEYAEISFADDGESPLLPHPLIKFSASIRITSNDTNILLAFIVGLPIIFVLLTNGFVTRW